jgi:hypothetical protein
MEIYQHKNERKFTLKTGVASQGEYWLALCYSECKLA